MLEMFVTLGYCTGSIGKNILFIEINCWEAVPIHIEHDLRIMKEREERRSGYESTKLLTMRINR